MRQRPANASRMSGFWELPYTKNLANLRYIRHLGTFRHTIVNTVFQVQVCTGVLAGAPAGYSWMKQAQEKVPVTTITRKALSLAAAKHRLCLQGRAVPE
jgi:uncharacterized protein (DUF849 family)